MKNLFFTFLFFFISPLFVFASPDAVPPGAIDSVVQIKIVERERGVILQYLDEITGTLISKDGKILTDYKKVKKIVDFPNRYRAIVCRNYGDMSSAGCGFEATVIDTDIHSNIAVLQVNIMWETSEDKFSYGKVFKMYYEGIQKEKYPFENYVSSLEKVPEIGSSVYVLGYPKNGGSVMIAVSALVSGAKKREILLDTTLVEGLSGGAVFTEDDSFLGVVTSHNPKKLGRFLNPKWINEFFIQKATPVDLAGSLEVPCGKNTKEKENGICECKAGFLWRNELAKCEVVKSDGYCGENAYRSGDVCECFEGFLWGSSEGSLEIRCLSPLEITKTETENPEASQTSEKRDQTEEFRRSYLWKKLIFTPIDDLKIFAKKLKNGRILLLWRSKEEGKMTKNCHLSFWDEAENEGKVIFQKKNIAIIQAKMDKKYFLEIKNCLVDDSEKTAESRFYAEEKEKNEES